MKIENLIAKIDHSTKVFQQYAVSSANLSVTLRNWLVGYYIVEFEQDGKERAKYGAGLMNEIAERVKHIKGLSLRNLKSFRQFYLCYSQFQNLFLGGNSILPVQLQKALESQRNLLPKSDQLAIPKGQTLSALFQLSDNESINHNKKLVTGIPFSNFIELIKIDDDLKRTFYEVECIKGNWSVRWLKRQISTLLYERIGMSKNKAEMIRLANDDADLNTISNFIRQPYIFEFIGLKDKDIVSENELENALIEHLQEFIMEMGEGFCFEARQKRIPFETTFGVVDLVFYQRILKCHVLIELKVGDFDYSALTQLNTYVSYYRQNVMRQDDKPTIGILLCTGKDRLMVEYALAGLDEKIFVSEYLLYIPSKDQLIEFIKEEIRKQ